MKTSNESSLQQTTMTDSERPESHEAFLLSFDKLALIFKRLNDYRRARIPDQLGLGSRSDQQLRADHRPLRPTEDVGPDQTGLPHGGTHTDDTAGTKRYQHMLIFVAAPGD